MVISINILIIASILKGSIIIIYIILAILVSHNNLISSDFPLRNKVICLSSSFIFFTDFSFPSTYPFFKKKITAAKKLLV